MGKVNYTLPFKSEGAGFYTSSEIMKACGLTDRAKFRRLRIKFNVEPVPIGDFSTKRKAKFAANEAQKFLDKYAEIEEKENFDSMTVSDIIEKLDSISTKLQEQKHEIIKLKQDKVTMQEVLSYLKNLKII